MPFLESNIAMLKKISVEQIRRKIIAAGKGIRYFVIRCSAEPITIPCSVGDALKEYLKVRKEAGADQAPPCMVCCAPLIPGTEPEAFGVKLASGMGSTTVGICANCATRHGKDELFAIACLDLVMQRRNVN